MARLRIIEGRWLGSLEGRGHIFFTQGIGAASTEFDPRAESMFAMIYGKRYYADNDDIVEVPDEIIALARIEYDNLLAFWQQFGLG